MKGFSIFHALPEPEHNLPVLVAGGVVPVFSESLVQSGTNQRMHVFSFAVSIMDIATAEWKKEKQLPLARLDCNWFIQRCGHAPFSFCQAAGDPANTAGRNSIIR